MWLTFAALSALVNLVLFVGIPFLPYYIFHRRRFQRGLAEIAARRASAR